MLAQVNHNAVIVALKRIKALGIFGAAQIGKGHNGVDRQNDQKGEQILSLHGVAFAIQRKFWLIKVLDPLQCAHTGRHLPFILDEKCNDQPNENHGEDCGGRPYLRKVVQKGL